MTIDKSKRRAETYTVESITKHGEYTEVLTTEHMGFQRKTDDIGTLKKGDVFVLETINYSTIVGLRCEGKWLFRLSDEDVEQERQDWLAKWEARKVEQLEKNRAEYEKIESELPEWLRERIQHFHEQGGVDFEKNGWGYELAVAQLTALYVDSKGKDDAKINKFAKKEGTSGNQHDVAKALARMHTEEPERSMAGTISALSPLTGDTDYSGKK